MVYYVTTTFRDVPTMLSQNVPPTFFPRVVLAAIALASVALITTSVRRQSEPTTPLPRSVYVTTGVLAAAIAMVPLVGMLGTVVVVAVVLPIYWGERGWIRVAGLAVGLPLFVYLVFVVALGMRLPAAALW